MFTAACYNIKCASLVGFDMSLIANDIKAVGADIAGIQEVDRLTARNGKIDTMPVLADCCNLNFYGFAKAMPYNGGEYGIGFLSRFRPENKYFHALPSMQGLEPRVYCSVQLSIQQRPVCFVNTHLSYENTEIQKIQLKALGNYLWSLDMPFVLTGDFNTDNFDVFENLGVPVTLMNNKNRIYRSFYPSNIAIDNIIISHSLKFVKTGMYTATRNSDHYMLYAQIDFI